MGVAGIIGDSFRGKRVLVTGHTGFKGGWLTLWLSKLGAKVHGIALPPETDPAIFEVCDIANACEHRFGDIRDYGELRDYVAAVAPDVIFHMAAQPIVRKSFDDPLDTLSTNIMGTAHVLEAVREWGGQCAVVVVSSDKCYDNREWVWGYRENDPMGGKDPYSMSKGATELVTSSWRDSFFANDDRVKLASARAGNVIGGGDWAKDRIVPDCIRAFAKGESVELRNPNATRPWQHVLEPLGGYLTLAANLLTEDAQQFCSGWNFGPSPGDVKPVSDIVALIAENWGEGCDWVMSDGPHPKEANMLSLNCDKAINLLDWHPTWNLERAIAETVSWYRSFIEGEKDMAAFTIAQIEAFESDMG